MQLKCKCFIFCSLTNFHMYIYRFHIMYYIVISKIQKSLNLHNYIISPFSDENFSKKIFFKCVSFSINCQNKCQKKFCLCDHVISIFLVVYRLWVNLSKMNEHGLVLYIYRKINVAFRFCYTVIFNNKNLFLEHITKLF